MHNGCKIIATTSNNMHNGGISTSKHPTMTTTDISARLRALASDNKNRPETARLRDVFNDVEQALKAGVKQSVVLAELHKSGFTMTMASFKSALQRIRKERAEGALPASSSSPTAHETSKTEPNTKVEKPDLGVGGEEPMETNPLMVLGGEKKPGEFNPIPHAKIEFD